MMSFRIGSFWPKIEVFYRPEWSKKGYHLKINFEYFWIQKWMLQTVRAEKVDEKNGVICLVSIFPSWVMVLRLCKKFIFCNFVLTSARNLPISKFIKNKLKQFTYRHLKGLVMHVQKMVLFIMPWLTNSEILGFEVKEFC